jgi:uncharacterized membrane protein YbhN (UPF0104 family)
MSEVSANSTLNSGLDSTSVGTSKGTSLQQGNRQWNRQAILRRAVHGLIALVVIVGIGRSLQLAWNDLQQNQSKVENRILQLDHLIASSMNAQERQLLEEEKRMVKSTQMDWKSLRVFWIPLSCVAGFLSILMPGILWWIVLKSFDTQPPFLATQAAYSVGSLGKYVPGKAMVPIMRSASMRRWGVPVPVSIIGVVIETLVSLSAAGTMGAITLSASNPPLWIFQVSIAAAVLSIVPIVPPIFNWLVRQVAHRKRLLRMESDSLIKHHLIGWKLVFQCWSLAAIGWVLMGTSLFAAVTTVSPRILRDVYSEIMSGIFWGDIAIGLQLWILCIATAALAFVIGFLSMLPGGAGVRELIVTVLLAPIVGYAPALAAAVLYRITSLVAELAMAGLTSIASRDNQKL